MEAKYTVCESLMLLLSEWVFECSGLNEIIKLAYSYLSSETVYGLYRLGQNLSACVQQSKHRCVVKQLVFWKNGRLYLVIEVEMSPVCC